MIRRAVFRPAADRDLARLDPLVRARILAAVERFALTGQGDVKQLQGRDKEFRLRVGKWRILFRYLAPNLVDIGRIDNRGEAY